MPFDFSVGIWALHVFLQVVKRFESLNALYKIFSCLDIQHCSIVAVLLTVCLYIYSCNISVSPVIRVLLQHCCGIADCVCTCTTAASL